MRKRLIICLVLIALLLSTMIGVGPTLAATGDPALINEVLASHSGTDDTEFVEFFGTPGYSLHGLSLIVVEGDAGADPGTIDRQLDFGPTDVLNSDGFYLVGNPVGLAAHYGVTPNIAIGANYLENSSMTVALVETSSISGSSVSGGEIVLDAVALTDGGAGDQFFFNAPVIGPDGTYFPAGARRIVDGLDTDTAADWLFADFSLGLANTPGAPNPPPNQRTIPEIQGSGQFSAFEGEVAETHGVVTLFTANGANFWMQDPAGDGDPATSDGIFVAGGGEAASGPRPAVGDLIRIIAQVDEQQFGNALPLTRLRSVSLIEVLSSGNPLPAPIELNDLPNESIQEGTAFWEPLEGMLVSVRNAPVVAATSGYGEFGMLTKDDAKPGSGYFADSKQILLQDLGDEVVDYNPERIMVDDSSLDEAIMVQPGDRVRSLVGVVDYTFSMYKLQPDTFDIKFHDLPNLPASTRSGGFGNVIITTFNVENLFDDFADPNDGKDDEGSTLTTEELETKLSKLALAIQVELELPEILVVQEIENQAIAQELANRVNDAAGTDYMAVSFETSDARGIEVAFIWDTEKVQLVEAYQMSGPDVEAWFGPTSPSPGREPLVGIFDIMGHQVTIVGNHFKSKSGDDPLYGVNWPPIRVTETQRKGQAQTVRNFVNTILDEDSNALVMVAGDLNDFQFGEPGEGPDHPVAILEGVEGGVPLINLLNLEKDDERYTYLFDGNAQVLDHMLVSPALLDYFQAADVLHFNTNTPTLLLEDDRTSPFSASDHDPLEGRFKFK
jgi:predicted extracellular nuclease